MKLLYEFLAKEGKPRAAEIRSKSLKLSKLAFVPLPLLSLVAWICLNWWLTHMAGFGNHDPFSRGVLFFGILIGTAPGAMIGLLLTAVAGLRRGPGRRLRMASWIFHGTVLAVSASFLFKLKLSMVEEGP